MTKKHFRMLAHSLQQLKGDLERASADGCDNSMSLAYEAHEKRVIEICRLSNPSFDASRFRDAIHT